MVYQQTKKHLKYGSYPIAAHSDSFDPHSERHRARCFLQDGAQIFRCCSLHNHLAMEIILVEEGHVRATTNSGRIDAAEGDILIFNPFEIHTIHTLCVDRPVRYTVINFDTSVLRCKASTLLDPLLDSLEEGSLQVETLFRRDDPIAGAMTAHIRSIFSRYVQREDDVSAFVGIMSELFAVFALLCEGNRFLKTDRKKQSRSTLFSQKTVRFVTEHYAEPISTERIAEYLHFNKSYFCRNFRSVFGQHFSEYLNEFRITTAKSLSLRDFRSLAELAESVGYASYTVFAKEFRKQTGISPREFYR